MNLNLLRNLFSGTTEVPHKALKLEDLESYEDVFRKKLQCNLNAQSELSFLDYENIKK